MHNILYKIELGIPQKISVEKYIFFSKYRQEKSFIISKTQKNCLQSMESRIWQKYFMELLVNYEYKLQNVSLNVFFS